MLRRNLAKMLDAVVVATVIGVLWAGGVAAQDRLVHVEGRVEWISGETMVIAPYGAVLAPGGTSAINVDLSQVSQDDYTGLTTGDPVAVTGTVPKERDRVVASSVQRLPSDQ
jgi:hypothetical protein